MTDVQLDAASSLPSNMSEGLPHLKIATKGALLLDAGCGNGKYLGLNPSCFYIGCDISPSLISICAGRGHEVVVADAVILPYRTGFGDAAISIAVLHHLSTESRRKKAVQELVRVVRKGGLVLITEQEDRSLLNKWTPLTHMLEEWVGPGSPCVRSPSTPTLRSISEIKEYIFGNDTTEQTEEKFGMSSQFTCEVGGSSVTSEDASGSENQQEYFVPWHLPYHRAEVSDQSASAVASGLARKDDKKGAVVYSRYYHVFMEGELERLVSGIEDAVVVDKFYDKSNCCIILEKL